MGRRARRASSVVSIILLPVMIGACQFFGPGDGVGPSAKPEQSPVACSGWHEMTDQERVALADRVVGDSADLIERVRVRQHQPVGTPRDVLILDVAQSLTKLCDVWAAPERPVIEVFNALY